MRFCLQTVFIYFFLFCTVGRLDFVFAIVTQQTTGRGRIFLALLQGVSRVQVGVIMATMRLLLRRGPAFGSGRGMARKLPNKIGRVAQYSHLSHNHNHNQLSYSSFRSLSTKMPLFGAGRVATGCAPLSTVYLTSCPSVFGTSQRQLSFATPSSEASSSPSIGNSGDYRLTESYVLGDTEPALLDETIYANFSRQVQAHPDRLCVASLQQEPKENQSSDQASFSSLTYADVDVVSQRVAVALTQDLQLKPGDRVAMWAFNCWEWVVMQIATARAGLVLVNLSPAYQADELAHALKLTGITAIVTQVSS